MTDKLIFSVMGLKKKVEMKGGGQEFELVSEKLIKVFKQCTLKIAYKKRNDKIFKYLNQDIRGNCYKQE